MYLIGRPLRCRIKVEVLGVTWPLTPEPIACQPITRGCCSIGAVALCFEETPGRRGEGLSPQPAHAAEHTPARPGYN